MHATSSVCIGMQPHVLLHSCLGRRCPVVQPLPLRGPPLLVALQRRPGFGHQVGRHGLDDLGQVAPQPVQALLTCTPLRLRSMTGVRERTQRNAEQTGAPALAMTAAALGRLPAVASSSVRGSASAAADAKCSAASDSLALSSSAPLKGMAADGTRRRCQACRQARRSAVCWLMHSLPRGLACGTLLQPHSARCWQRRAHTLSSRLMTSVRWVTALAQAQPPMSQAVHRGPSGRLPVLLGAPLPPPPRAAAVLLQTVCQAAPSSSRAPMAEAAEPSAPSAAAWAPGLDQSRRHVAEPGQAWLTAATHRYDTAGCAQGQPGAVEAGQVHCSGRSPAGWTRPGR